MKYHQLTSQQRSQIFALLQRITPRKGIYNIINADESGVTQGKRAKPLAMVVVKMLYAYRRFLKAITADNGSEFAAHTDITKG